MKIETKFNIGDVVWCYDYYHNLVSGTVTECCALETKAEVSIVYKLKVNGTGGSIYTYQQHECVVYPTKQEAKKCQ